MSKLVTKYHGKLLQVVLIEMSLSEGIIIFLLAIKFIHSET